ncbi:MAG TPA: tetratricopeptide repeat protein [Bacteroidia bacterium]|nr:tetratricopeptide repeat protein [Bacteroidia bacterium]
MREFNIKINYVLLLLTVLIAGQKSLAQSEKQKLDSLFKVVKTVTQDSTKANAYTAIAEQYLLFNVDSAFLFIKEYDLIGQKLQLSKNEKLRQKGLKLHATALLTRANGFFYLSQNDSATHYAKSALEVYKKTKDEQGIAACNNTLGNVEMNLSNLDEAERYFMLNYNNRKVLGVSKIVGAACNNLGMIAGKKADYKAASNYYLESLRIKDSLGDTKGVAKTYNNLGLLHAEQGDGKTALKYYNKSLEIDLELNDKKGEAVALNNMAIIYFQHEKNYPKSIETNEKALAIREAIGDKKGIGSSLNNLGTIYNVLTDSMLKHNEKEKANEYLKKAEDYIIRALAVRREIKDQNGVASALNNLGSVFMYKNKIDEAIKICKEALELGTKLQIPEREEASCKCLYEAYNRKKDFKNALYYLQRQIALTDSIRNETTKKELLTKTLSYEFEKKSLADSLKNAEQIKLERLDFENKQTKQRYFTISAILVSVLMFVLLAVTFRNYRNKKKISETLTRQNKIITQQKEEVESKNIAINQQKEIIEEKNREIVDSIQYAKRIQDAILPDNKILNDYFSESFILFKPKDIVSGDFYWIEKKQNALHLAVVDCTGHGVPGAFISLLGYNLLNRSINEFNCKNPAEVLQCMDEKLEELLLRSSITVRDGMDLAFCTFHQTNNEIKMSFAGAHNPCWLIRKKSEKPVGKTILEFDEYALYELAANRQSIGGFTDKKPYLEESVSLTKGDMIYLFSDGYADQFGGDKGKKFKYGKLRELLLSINSKPLTFQLDSLNQTIEAWRGEQSQVDDICIIGIRV